VKRTDSCLGSDRRALNKPRNKLESTDSRVLEDGEESKQSKADTLAVHHQEPLEGNDTGEIYLLCRNRRRAATQQVFCILPVAVFGSSLTNETQLGALK
jgi:hypothetical protein